MKDKILLVDHIIDSVLNRRVSAVQAYSWLTGNGYIHCNRDEGWEVTYQRDGFFFKKNHVYVTRYSDERKRAVGIPLTAEQSKALWNLQREFDAINKEKQAAFDAEQNAIKERLKWWP